MTDQRLKKFARDLRNSSTLAEVLLWQRIKNKQIKGYQFLRQKPIGNYIVDFYCHKLKLALEIDGGSHYENREHDKIRDKKLQSLEIRTLRFVDRRVKKDMYGVILEIEKCIKDNT